MSITVSSNMYMLVEFQNNEIAVIPIEWLVDENVCVWPPFARSSASIMHAVRTRVKPDKTWSTYQLKRVMYRNGKSIKF